LIVIDPAPAEARSANSSIRAKCYKQVGAYYNPGRRRWSFYSAGRNTAQQQNFYNCLDSHTMKRGWRRWRNHILWLLFCASDCQSFFWQARWPGRKRNNLRTSVRFRRNAPVRREPNTGRKSGAGIFTARSERPNGPLSTIASISARPKDG